MVKDEVIIQTPQFLRTGTLKAQQQKASPIAQMQQPHSRQEGITWEIVFFLQSLSSKHATPFKKKSHF